MGQYNIYGYNPNEELAYAATAVFGVLFVVVMAINFKFKSWFFIVIPIASLMELVGFVLRPHAAYDVSKYVVSTLGILLAPTIYAMANYALIKRLMIKTDIRHPIFKPNAVRWIFLAGDILSFIIQCSGGGLTATSNPSMAKTGARMLLVGLCISLVVFVFFLFMTIYVHTRLRARAATEETKKIQVIICILYVDMILLIIRSAYRIAEYANMQYHNSISTNETLFYTLDILEMLILNLLWIPFHPGFWDMLDVNNDEEKSAVDA